MPALHNSVVETAFCVSYHLLSHAHSAVVKHQLPIWLPIYQPCTVHSITVLFSSVPTYSPGTSSTFLLARQHFHSASNWLDFACMFVPCHLFWQFFLLHMPLDSEGNMFVCNIRNHSLNTATSHRRKPESSVMLV
jgi:hypothetical protein